MKRCEEISVEYPFSDTYSRAWRVFHKGMQRHMVVLYANEKQRTTISLARYLMAVHLKRLLAKSEHVDHINNDRTDDRIENLQILSPKENQKKRNDLIETKLIECVCEACGTMFRKRLSGQKTGGGGIFEPKFCSRKCLYQSQRKDYRPNYMHYSEVTSVTGASVCARVAKRSKAARS